MIVLNDGDKCLGKLTCYKVVRVPNAGPFRSVLATGTAALDYWIGRKTEGIKDKEGTRVIAPILVFQDLPAAKEWDDAWGAMNGDPSAIMECACGRLLRPKYELKFWASVNDVETIRTWASGMVTRWAFRAGKDDFGHHFRTTDWVIPSRVVRGPSRGMTCGQWTRSRT